MEEAAAAEKAAADASAKAKAVAEAAKAAGAARDPESRAKALADLKEAKAAAKAAAEAAMRAAMAQYDETAAEEGEVAQAVAQPMVECKGCGETFLPMYLAQHQRACDACKPSKVSVHVASSLTACPFSNVPPRHRTCRALLPSVAPSPPPAFSRSPPFYSRPFAPYLQAASLSNSDEPSAQRESIEFADNDANTFVPCGFCSRTFFPDRLAVHHRSCKEKKKAAREARLGKMSGAFAGMGDRFTGDDADAFGGGSDPFAGGGGGGRGGGGYPGMAHMPGGGERGGGGRMRGGFGGGGGGQGTFGGGGDRFAGGGGYPGMAHMLR